MDKTMEFNIWNRRYTGSKQKLIKWIQDIIFENCKGNSFCDIFAGTGVVAYSMLDKMNKIIINDFLFSNEIIYKGFMSQEKYDCNKIEKYKCIFNSIEYTGKESNYVSINYGDKFFSIKDAYIIGEIREKIEQAQDLNNKEYAILLSSLIYSIDRIANTVGHYEAFIKGHELKDLFEFRLIKSYNSQSSINIYRKDANELAKDIKVDIVYIDPPYSSRQYSRFYHVLETIVKWDKPQLYGEALKPAPENMSEYCRSTANVAFNDLVQKLNCQYIVVSYNNTYNSKSSSSTNKMTLEGIRKILSKRGEVKYFEKEYPSFNAGKTNIENHKEILFITEVKNG